jgi:hypothetical protein
VASDFDTFINHLIIPRKICRPRRDAVSGEFRILHSDLRDHTLYC